jgi:transposase InsO family protein
VAIDDHSRASFVQMHRDRRKEAVVDFLRATVAHYKALGVTVKRLLTDNGSAYRSKLFEKTCQALGIKHTFIRSYRAQTNGRAERFIQTCLREWAYGSTWRTVPSALPGCLHSWLIRTPERHTRPSATSLQLPGLVGRTYCNSTGARTAGRC